MSKEAPTKLEIDAAAAEGPPQSNLPKDFGMYKYYEHDKSATSPESGSNSSSSSSSSSTSNSKSQNSSKSFINVPLIPLKIILFTWYAAGACLLPYMTLHMKQLGLNMAEMTAVYAILPIIQMFGTPIAGFIADRTGNYKSVLQISLCTCIVTTFLLQFAVPARKAPTAAAATNATSGGNGADAEADATAELMYAVTFWLYLFIRVFHQVAVGLSYVLLDATTLMLAEEHNSNYGRQRFWAILATGIFSPICGFIIDHISYTVDVNGAKINNYDPAFYFFNALVAFTLIKASMINVKISAVPTNVWSNIGPLLKSANVWIFLFSVFIMGSCWGFLESFLFVYLKELDAPNYLLGLTITVGALIGLPFLYESEWFVNKFGAVHLLILALVVYFIRLVGYSLIVNPWWCIPYELMEAFTLHLMWVSTVSLAYKISPPGMLATLQAVVGGLNFGVGRGFGSLVGGSVIVFYGNRIAFRVVGCMALTTAVLWATLNYCCLQSIEVHDKKKQITCNIENRQSKRRRQTGKDVEDSCPEIMTAAAAS